MELRKYLQKHVDVEFCKKSEVIEVKRFIG